MTPLSTQNTYRVVLIWVKESWKNYNPPNLITQTWSKFILTIRFYQTNCITHTKKKGKKKIRTPQKPFFHQQTLPQIELKEREQRKKNPNSIHPTHQRVRSQLIANKNNQLEQSPSFTEEEHKKGC